MKVMLLVSEEITPLVQRIQGKRDEEATELLWNAYYQRITKAARGYIGAMPKRVADEEDVALSALNSFFKAAENGRLEKMQDRDDLWRLLLTFTARKANRHKERAMAKKRGGGLAQGESGFVHAKEAEPHQLSEIPDQAFVGDLVAECNELISTLPDETLKTIATMRLKAYKVEEIADELGVVGSTIKRKLKRIREIWSENRREDE